MTVFLVYNKCEVNTMQNKYNQKISTDGKILMEGQKMLFFTPIDELPPLTAT